jgi:hypothetical protein
MGKSMGDDTDKKIFICIFYCSFFCLLVMQVVCCSNPPLCFIEYSNLKSIRLKLDIHDDNSATIQYKGQKGKIKLVFLRREELQRNQSYPSLYQEEWEEINHNKKTGKYIMLSQAAHVYPFIYLRYSDLKVFVFDEDPDVW